MQLNNCELMFWSETEPPTVTLRFHSKLVDHIVTIPVEFLQVNHLDPETGEIRRSVVGVKDSKVVEQEEDK